MIVRAKPLAPDRILLTREELEYLLAGFYAAGYAANHKEDEFAIVAVRERGKLSGISPDEFYPTLHAILERSIEL